MNARSDIGSELTRPTTREVTANGLDFTVLEMGTGPSALCLHGFPDSAQTWRYLLPRLASAGFHAVAPFMRGYAPTGEPADACYERGALVADGVELHDALGGDGDAVLIGHDWGAEAAYGAPAFGPERWRRLVTLAVPPPALDAELFSDYEQLKRFFYIFYFQAVSSSDATVWSGGLAFLRKLWQYWSPGYDAGDDLDFVGQALNEPARLAAALAYYRAEAKPRNSRYASYSSALAQSPSQPTLYLHGADDGCISATFAHQALPELAPGSRVQVIDHAGHFLHVERPDEVNDLILAWVAD